MPSYPEFIAKAGACLASTNVLSRAGRVRWMVRQPFQAPVDNGWRIFSHIDTEQYLADPANMKVVDFNAVCAIEPALIGIWDFPIGTDLQIVDAGAGVRIVDTASGREVPVSSFYVPPAHRQG